MSVFTTKEIPTEAEADRVVRLYEADGCTAEKKQEADGTWTVIATCPDQ
jgi:hypothetical protein